MRQLIYIAAVLLVLKTVLYVCLNFTDYVPPNFASDFLRGRERYFFGAYQCAFYVHIIAGPVTLLAGLLLTSYHLRRKFPRLHRNLGSFQVLCILLFIVPSGLWMAAYAQAGLSATVSFTLLSLATGLTAFVGWLHARNKRFAMHQRWMLRCFILLCSAVVIRVMGGMATTFGITWPAFDALSAWLCWTVPLLVLEIVQNSLRRQRSGMPAIE